MPSCSSPMLQSYSEFLASSFGNFTQTYFADHFELWSPDQINRQLRSQKWTPKVAAAVLAQSDSIQPPGLSTL